MKLRQKVLQVQMEWENRQRMEQNMVSNQGTMNQPFYIPPPMNGYGGGYSGGYGGGYGGYQPGPGGRSNMYPAPNQIYPNYPRNPSKYT